MSDLDATTPCVFLARHGNADFPRLPHYPHALSSLPLIACTRRDRMDYLGPPHRHLRYPADCLRRTPVTSAGSLLVGPGKLLDPKRVRRVLVSPRQRALRTFQLLFRGTQGTGSREGGEGRGGREVAGVREEIFGGAEGSIVVTEEIREWDYGEYEGMKAAEVREMRKQRGLHTGGSQWSVWRDGCEGGESKEDVERRLDRLIEEIQELQRPYMHGEGAGNVVLVAHGLILRCFVKRWLKLPVDDSLPMMLRPGALAVLSYKNHDVKEPAFYVGMALPAT